MRKATVFVLLLALGMTTGLFAEEAAACAQCGGTGIVTSEYEDTCGSCNGTGYAVCSTCGGSGQISEAWYPECEACHGSGKRGDQDCIGCGGTGRGKANYGCQDCGGTGLSRAACSACEGYGTVIVTFEDPCPACSPNG